MSLSVLGLYFPTGSSLRSLVPEFLMQVLMRVPRIRVQVTMLRSNVLMQRLMLSITAVIPATAAAVVSVAA